MNENVNNSKPAEPAIPESNAGQDDARPDLPAATHAAQAGSQEVQA